MDELEKDYSDSTRLAKLLEDSEKRYLHILRSLEGTKIRNRQLSISLNKEKNDKLRIKTALNVSREKSDENRICLNRNIEKVSHLENDVEELRREKTELLELFENEKERGKLLQSELELFQSTETLYSEMSADDVIDLTNQGQTENENVLQNLVVKLKKKLDTKDTECNEIEDKLSVMQQQLVCQSDRHTKANTEFEQQLNTLHESLAKERQLNRCLSEESDQRVRELQTQLQQKDEVNTEIQDSRDQSSQRLISVEEQCCFYRTKLKDTEERLIAIYNEQLKQRKSVSCQVCESELSSPPDETVYEMFREIWAKGNNFIGQFGNNTRYKLTIIQLLQNGFKQLGGNS